MTSPSPRYRLAAGVVALTLVGSACGSDSGGVEASDAWARPSPMMADAAAVYLNLSSDEEITIASASVAGDVAGRAELHETVAIDDMEESMDEGEMEESMSDGDMEEGDMEESMDEGEMDEESMDEDGHMGDMAMTMRPIEGGLTVPAGGEVAFEPGGLHVMLLDLPEPLEEGETFDLTLTEDDGDEITVSVEVRSEAP